MVSWGGRRGGILNELNSDLFRKVFSLFKRKEKGWKKRRISEEGPGWCRTGKTPAPCQSVVIPMSERCQSDTRYWLSDRWILHNKSSLMNAIARSTFWLTFELKDGRYGRRSVGGGQGKGRTNWQKNGWTDRRAGCMLASRHVPMVRWANSHECSLGPGL